ncbi:hypothetical protein KFK09_004584 [Dendrobium nobile]|uniref:Uncharacterized protein n=1 Tax=Dendrobium nobile TaxID=94219 RepID=A0A8T3C0R0_DENNO|nr:hypothetical protein KFK09_004582 [Dendrobium nobile]KAI0525192.1 hypothetical protein KFK09_004584 [Dendrobium nobile]
MTVMLKKLQQKYARVKDEMVRWDELQSQMLSQFGNGASIINRLQVLNVDKNYDALEVLPGIKETLLGKQIETLEMIFISLTELMKEFHRIVLSLDKIARDANQLLREATPYQMQLCVGTQPSLQQCLDGLNTFHKMHKSEFLLKSSILSSLMLKYFKCSADDVATLRQLLVDQPNIPKDEVQTIFDIILPKVADDGLTGR